MLQTELTGPAATLKDRTAEHHRRAERAGFQQALIKGRIDRTDYVAWLGQMLCVYRALESAWTRARGDERFPALGLAGWARSRSLERDLEALDADTMPQPFPATLPFLSLMDALGARGGDALLGVIYVLEGSTNGSVYIARSVRGALQLPAGMGTAFLDPYGERQRERWAAFRTALDQAVSPESFPAIEAAACATFDAVTAISDAIESDRRAATR